MNFNIRKAERKDYPAILGLIKELAAFENASEQVTNSVAQMEAEEDLFQCLVTENDNGEIVAMALFYFTYFTWVGKSLYLDDLFVQEAYRGNEIGSKLINEIFKIAKSNNCNRVRWQVLDWNEPAIGFYEKIGATIEKDWYNCDFDKEGISNFF